jgi:hypothetical protein
MKNQILSNKKTALVLIGLLNSIIALGQDGSENSMNNGIDILNGIKDWEYNSIFWIITLSGIGLILFAQETEYKKVFNKTSELNSIEVIANNWGRIIGCVLLIPMMVYLLGIFLAVGYFIIVPAVIFGVAGYYYNDKKEKIKGEKGQKF